jgi:hypothetical protein
MQMRMVVAGLCGIFMASGCSGSLAPPSTDPTPDLTVDVSLHDGTGGDSTIDGGGPPLLPDSTIDSAPPNPTADSTVDGPVGDTTHDGPVPDSTFDLPPADTTVDTLSPDSYVDAGCQGPPTGEWVKETELMNLIPALQTVRAIAGKGPNDVYVASSGGHIWHRNQGGWVVHSQISPTGNSVYVNSLWIDGPRLFAAGGSLGDGFVGVYENSSWSFQTLIPGTTNDLSEMRAITGVSSSEIYVVGDKEILSYDGSSWSNIVAPGQSMRAAAARGPKDFLFGQGNEIYHFIGGIVQAMPVIKPSTGNITSLWVNGPDTYAGATNAPGGAAIVKFNGTTWAAMSVPSSIDILAIHGRDKNDIFAIGTSSSILHFDGSSWQERWSGSLPQTGIQLESIWIDNSGTVGFAGGSQSQVWRFGRCF